MTINDFAELFEVLLVLLGILMFWNFAVRPVLLDIVRSAEYRLRDDLRNWYMKLPRNEKQKYQFSYQFLERAINCVASSVSDVSLWGVFAFSGSQASKSAEMLMLEKQIDRYMTERSIEIEALDSQHGLLFALLLMINSPGACLFLFFKALFQVVHRAAKAENYVSPVKAQVEAFRDASHQQASLI